MFKELWEAYAVLTGPKERGPASLTFVVPPDEFDRQLQTPKNPMAVYQEAQLVAACSEDASRLWSNLSDAQVACPFVLRSHSPARLFSTVHLGTMQTSEVCFESSAMGFCGSFKTHNLPF